MSSLAMTKFEQFEENVAGNLVQCRHTNVDEVLNKFFTKDCDFPDYKDVKYMCIAVGGDHGKGAFTMLVTMHIELHSSRNPVCLDEVVGEMDSSKDGIEVLRPLALY